MTLVARFEDGVRVDMKEWKKWLDYTLLQIERAPIRLEPYPHLYIRNIFHRDCYAKLTEAWPSLERFEGQQESSHSEMECPVPDLRRILLTEDVELVTEEPKFQDFWRSFDKMIRGEELSRALVKRASPAILEVRDDLPEQVTITPHSTLEWDLDGFQVTPHLDDRRYLLTCLFYAPDRFDSPQLGTALLEPKPHLYEQYQNLGNTYFEHYWDWNDFEEVTRAPFIPNSLFVLIVSPRAYHALPRIENSEGNRKNILLNIYHDYNQPFVSLRDRFPGKYANRI